MAVADALENLVHRLTAKLHEELQQVSLGQKKIPAVGDLQPTGSLEVFDNLRYQ
jgi:hypothetical protein